MHYSAYIPLMIPITELVHGHYYAGKCRNATIARWNHEKQEFTHWREKFGHTFVETIKHESDPEPFDKFIPLFDITYDLDNAKVNQEKMIPMRGPEGWLV